MRGGGPAGHGVVANIVASSPHARGWSGFPHPGLYDNDVFPACAGVVPKAMFSPPQARCLPRMRGGGPQGFKRKTDAQASSPHTRGWSLIDDGRVVVVLVFPAYAGVVRTAPPPHADG